MSAAINKSRSRVCAQLRFGLACILISATTIAIRPQGSGQNDVLPPRPNSNLVSIHLPDLTSLESEVRKQLVSSQDELAAAIKDPRALEGKLSDSYGMMGEVYQAYSFFSSARECYLNATRLSPKDFRWIYLLGKIDQLEGRFDEAIRRYQIVRAVRPDYVAANVNLGNIYLQLNRLEEAERSFEAALAIDQNSAAANYGLGQAALSRRRYEAAAHYFESALAEAPAANRIHYSLGMAYRGLGEVEKAKSHLTQQGPVGVRVADPLVDSLQELIAGVRVHLIRGKLALSAKRYTEAAGEFQKALAARPDSFEAHLNLGAVLTQTGDLRGAVAEFQAAVRIDPKSSIAHYNLAVLLVSANNHESAITHLRSVLSIDASDLAARFLLAQELLKDSRLEEALAEFSRVVQADPNNEEALLGQAKLLLRKEQHRQALDSLEKGHERYPQKGETAIMLAYLLAASPQYDLRDGARALKLAQSVYQTTGLASHGAIVAVALAELGRCDEASSWLRQMMAKASQEGKSDFVEKLKAEANSYERARPCRPRGHMVLF